MKTTIRLLAGILVALFAVNCGGGGSTGAVPQTGGSLNEFPQADTGTSIYVADFGTGRIVRFPANGNGNIVPTETIAGANTFLSAPIAIANGPGGELFVLNTDRLANCDFSSTGYVTVYAPTAAGDTAPSRLFGGSDFNASVIDIAVDSSGRSYVMKSVAGDGLPNDSQVLVYANGAANNVSPVATIDSSPETRLFSGLAVALGEDGKIYTFGRDPSTHTGQIDVYDAGSFGNVAPLSVITNVSTPDRSLGRITVDGSGNIYVSISLGIQQIYGSVVVYAPGSSGNAAPARLITGPDTGLRFVSGIAVDSAGYIYVTGSSGGTTQDARVAVFAPGANGDAKPVRIITGSATGLVTPDALVLR